MTRPDTHEFALPPDVLADLTRRRFLAGGAGLALDEVERGLLT